MSSYGRHRFTMGSMNSVLSTPESMYTLPGTLISLRKPVVWAEAHIPHAAKAAIIMFFIIVRIQI